MIEVLCIVLISIVVLLFLNNLVTKIIPRQGLTILGGAFILGIVFVAYFNPTYSPVTSFWTILSFPLKPLGLAITLGITFALSLDFKEFKKENKIKIKSLPNFYGIFVAILLLLVSSNPIFAYEIAHAVESDTIAIQEELREICVDNCLAVDAPSHQRVGAIVLLGTDTTEPYIPYRPQIQLERTGNRLLYTSHLFYQQRQIGNYPLVIICASPRNYLEGDSEQISEARDIAALLQRFGIAETQILKEEKGLTLRQNALEVEKILGNEHLLDRPIFLITSGIKMRRATQTFRKLKMKVIPMPTDFYTFQKDVTPKQRITVRSLLPSVEALKITTDVVDEYLATIYYLLRGWISRVCC